MKDFYDVWLLANTFSFHGQVLANAINATFLHRNTTVHPMPIAFTAAFTDQPT
jgi:hypothetical protein